MKKPKLIALRAIEKCIRLHEDTNDNKAPVLRILRDTVCAETRAIMELKTELIEAHVKISKAHAVIRTLHETMKTGNSIHWNHRDSLELIDDMVFEALLCIGTAGEMTE
jgi:hypothetical protein